MAVIKEDPFIEVVVAFNHWLGGPFQRMMLRWGRVFAGRHLNQGKERFCAQVLAILFEAAATDPSGIGTTIFVESVLHWRFYQDYFLLSQLG